MRSLLHTLVAFCLAWAPNIRAQDPQTVKLVAADMERVAATKSADREKLAAIFSDDLRYAHSSGTVDTKQSYIESLTSGRTKYLALDYEERASAQGQRPGNKPAQGNALGLRSKNEKP